VTRFLSLKDFGNFSIKEGKLKTWRKSKDASQKQRWRKSKKARPISKRAAVRLQRP